MKWRAKRGSHVIVCLVLSESLFYFYDKNTEGHMNYGKSFCGSGGSVFFGFGWLARFFVVILFWGRGLSIDFGGREELSRV